MGGIYAARALALIRSMMRLRNCTVLVLWTVGADEIVMCAELEEENSYTQTGNMCMNFKKGWLRVEKLRILRKKNTQKLRIWGWSAIACRSALVGRRF